MQEKIRVIFQYAFQEQCFQKSVLNANKIEALSAWIVEVYLNIFLSFALQM